jgi:hypothetical protein
MIMSDKGVQVQEYAPHVKGINTSIPKPKRNEVLSVGRVKIRLASDIDVRVIDNLKSNVKGQIYYFNSL